MENKFDAAYTVNHTADEGCSIQPCENYERLNGARPVFRDSRETGAEIRRRCVKEEREALKDKEFVSIVCRGCGREFLIGRAEMEWFWSKGMVLPHRCPVCRAHRRIEKQMYMSYVGGRYADRRSADHGDAGRGVKIYG